MERQLALLESWVRIGHEVREELIQQLKPQRSATTTEEEPKWDLVEEDHCWGDSTFYSRTTDFSALIDDPFPIVAGFSSTHQSRPQSSNALHVLACFVDELTPATRGFTTKTPTQLNLRNQAPHVKTLVFDFLSAVLLVALLRLPPLFVEEGDGASQLASKEVWDRHVQFREHTLWRSVDALPSERPTTLEAKRLLADYLIQVRSVCCFLPPRFFEKAEPKMEDIFGGFDDDDDGAVQLVAPPPADTDRPFLMTETYPIKTLCLLLHSLVKYSSARLLGESDKEGSTTTVLQQQQQRLVDDQAIFMISVADAVREEGYDFTRDCVDNDALVALCHRRGCQTPVRTVATKTKPEPFGHVEPAPLVLLWMRLRCQVQPTFQGVKRWPLEDLALRTVGFRRCIHAPVISASQSKKISSLHLVGDASYEKPSN